MSNVAYPLTLVVGLLSSSDALAQDVGINGAACNFSTIGAALALSAPGDILYLKEGATVVEPGFVINQDVTIEAGTSVCGAGGVLPATIAGSGIGHIEITAGALATMSRVVVTGHEAYPCGGNLHVVDGTLTLEDSTVQRGKAELGGGICVAAAGTLNLTDSLVTANVAVLDALGGSGFGGGVHVEGGQVFAVGSTISSNRADGPGGGLAVVPDPVGLVGGSVDMTASSVELNDAASGGGIYVGDSSSYLCTATCEITSNVAADHGGGIYADAGSTATVLPASNIDYNVATAGNGGAVFAVDATVIISTGPTVADTVEWNEAGVHGGGIFAAKTSVVDLTIGRMVENSALGGDGGALYATDDAIGVIRGDIGANNASDDGGAIALAGQATFSMQSPTTNLEFNFAGGDGGAASVEGDAILLLMEAVFLGSNDAGGNGGGIHVTGNGTVEMFGGMVTHNFAGAGGGGLSMEDGAVVTTHGVRFRNNEATTRGGGIGIWATGAGVPTLSLLGDVPVATCDDGAAPGTNEYCAEVRGNDAPDGAGLSMAAGTAVVSQAAFIANQSAGDLAIELLDDEAPALTLHNVLVTGHVGTLVIHVEDNTSFEAQHVTLAGNTGTPPLHLEAAANGFLRRSIVWGNGAALIVDPVGFSGTCTAFGTLGGAGGFAGANMTLGVDPQFQTVAGDNFRLTAAGSPNSVDECAAGGPIDLLGLARPVGASFDRGAFEAP